MNAFRIIPEIALSVPEPMMHQRHCARCPSAHGPDDPETADIKTWPLRSRIETMFVCAWGPRRYCRGYCDAMGISQEDLEREHSRRHLASVDTHPKDGDALAAPLGSGAVPQGDAPNTAAQKDSPDV